MVEHLLAPDSSYEEVVCRVAQEACHQEGDQEAHHGHLEGVQGACHCEGVQGDQDVALKVDHQVGA